MHPHGEKQTAQAARVSPPNTPKYKKAPFIVLLTPTYTCFPHIIMLILLSAHDKLYT